ncbi:Selenocysteine lyase/Cysteine desulfurase [Catalinimonas alkaloidigena]|uniref:Selenocysteine lyase/Cysteine desulfurase n=1 Tax=Catalinimonas alkaloidigena TaxID=1075417 RepID=A0A1G9R428_9BACT|nr:aminotransferase class V-fold PLP-dependent enzyme [Catalinimonas alkaloidigena]SDM17988.1 Selenocysteine lyase/Cysteine desulfurase [Catalinimonas alkaloidigena]
MSLSTPSLNINPALLQQWRYDTPGCTERLHLNNAGASLMTRSVVEAVTHYLEREMMLGGYELAALAADEIEGTYRALAQLIGALPEQIALVENATVAVSQALSAFDWQAGDVVLTTNVDYSSNQIMLLSLAQRRGVRVIRAEDLPEGGVDPASVQALIAQHRPKLVLMTWVPTNSGLVQDAQAVGQICREADVPLILDACQAVGQLPLDVHELHCDFLAATSRKFLRGPRGLGFLYVSERALKQGWYPLYLDTQGGLWSDPNAFEVRDDAKRFENFEFSQALIVGLGEAARYALRTGVIGYRRAGALADYTRDRLADLDGVEVLDRGTKRCAIVTAAVAGHDARTLMQQLREANINLSAAARNHGVIDMDAKGATTALRISPHYYNTTEEIDALIDALTIRL